LIVGLLLGKGEIKKYVGRLHAYLHYKTRVAAGSSRQRCGSAPMDRRVFANILRAERSTFKLSAPERTTITRTDLLLLFAHFLVAKGPL